MRAQSKDHTYCAARKVPGKKDVKASPNVAGIAPRQTARKTARPRKVGDVDLSVFREGPITRGGPLDPTLPENRRIYESPKTSDAELVIPKGGTHELDAMQGEPIDNEASRDEPNKAPEESG